MTPLLLALVLSADPDRYLGGATPTPASVPGPADETPTHLACSTTTLRNSSQCFFDGRAETRDTDAARKKQAKDNVELARRLGAGLCAERSDPTLEDRERQRRLGLCVKSTARAAEACGLQGQEVLLDAEGRFSTRARACYESLATALQTSDLPPTPASEPEAPPTRPRAAPMQL